MKGVKMKNFEILHALRAIGITATREDDCARLRTLALRRTSTSQRVSNHAAAIARNVVSWLTDCRGTIAENFEPE